MERELVMSGIGGQGVQLASSVLATAAFAEGLEVQLFGSYGGMMRGGATEAAVVFGTDAIEAPPTMSSAWSVILLHHEHSAHARACVRPGGIVMVNTSVVDVPVDTPGVTVVDVPATDIASEVGHPMAASLVMAGAYVAATSLVSLEALTAAVAATLPPYRAQHRELNERALAAGADAVGRDLVPAWPSEAPASGARA